MNLLETKNPMKCPTCGRRGGVIRNGYKYRFMCGCRNCGTIWKVFNRKCGPMFPIEICEEKCEISKVTLRTE